jgi:hypothetical protein
MLSPPNSIKNIQKKKEKETNPGAFDDGGGGGGGGDENLFGEGKAGLCDFRVEEM